MRYGTFLCWLFGHKFIEELRNEKMVNGIKDITIQLKQTPICVRCGIDREAK